MRLRLLIATVFLVSFLLFVPVIAEAHRSGCHRWHTCPSDTGSYGSVTPTSSPTSVPAPPPASQPANPQPQSRPDNPARPKVDWHTYDTAPEFQDYWKRNGGLPTFGFAKTTSYRSNGWLAQIFERNRFELHPENRPPYNVQLGLLGEERLLQLGRVWQNEPQGTPQPSCQFFKETGHNLCEPFLSYWKAHGLEFDGRRGTSEAERLALFGYPITEATLETGADGVARLTQ